MGNRPGPLLYPAAFFCVPFRELRAKVMLGERGVSSRLCVAQKAATPPTVSPRSRPEESEARQRVLS